MVELESVLKQHYNRYPKMTAQDMVKLIYQNEFAGGHFVDDELKSLERLEEEYSLIRSLGKDRLNPMLFEDIGAGLCRINLAALPGRGIDIGTVNRFFVTTANSHRGTMESFQSKLDVLRTVCKNGEFPLSLQELELYLADYERQGFPAVSHSKIYRSTYHPAYRAISTRYRDYVDVFQRIDLLSKSEEPVLIAIDGHSGAGKSTLAGLLSEIYDCNVFHMDDFFLTPELRTVERLQEAGGNVDYVRFNAEVMRGILSREEFRYGIYDCSRGAIREYVDVVPKRLNVIEGSYSMHPTLVGKYHLKVFLGVSPEEQKKRILERNGPIMYERFRNEWIPLENYYFDQLKIADQSDLVY